MNEIAIESLAFVALICGLLCILGMRAAAKILLIYAIRKGIVALPESNIGLWEVWPRYLHGYLLVKLPVLEEGCEIQDVRA